MVIARLVDSLTDRDDSDEYADLRYNPDWRRNFEEARLFHKLRTRLSLEHGVHDGTKGSDESLGQLQSLTRRRSRENVNAIGHRVVRFGGSTEAHVTVEKLSGVQADLPASSFHLHPPEHQVAVNSSSATSSQTLSPPASVATGGGGHSNRTLKESRIPKPQRHQHHRATLEGHDLTGEPPDQGEEGTRRVKDHQGAFPLGQKSHSHRRSNARAAKPRTDKVELNKVTLGVNRSKQGSYLRRHGKGSDQPERTDEAQESEEDSSTDRREDEGSLDSEHLWLQRTQRLKVSQGQEERRPQPKGRRGKPAVQNRPKRSHAAQTRCPLSPLPAGPSAAGDAHAVAEILVIDEARPSSYASDTPTPPPPPLRPAAVAQQPRRSPLPASLPSSGGTPMVNLNINLSTSNGRDFFPHTSREQHQHQHQHQHHQQQQQAGLLTLVPPGAPQWVLKPQVHPVQPFTGSDSSPGHFPLPPHAAGMGQWALLMASPGAAPGAGQQGLDMLMPPAGAHLWGLNSERVAVWQPNADWSQEPAVQTRDPSLKSSHSTGSVGPYAVLPPIGRTVAEEERVAGAALAGVGTLGPRSCSDGYLAQLERQRHTKAPAGYKVYTLKDYKSIKHNVKLGGLGPSKAVTESTAEKMRRQKLYSDVIRQQNKSISRIPFLPAQAKTQAPERTNKDTTPRTKALEYARTIAKPKVSPRPKQEAQETQAVTAQAQAGYLSEVDMGRLTLLETLRQRHEQEKQAVAQLNAVHAV
ncbi:jhy protein homolog isoform X2 [Sardina pilchardus]|uniref:jhy protein homolog isoform X2 n=1 Tax=Sardina pilchardus TaxID=27697 RepID=UPI002E0E5CCA